MDKKILVLGVSGSGKSLIGEQLAKLIGLKFFDGDDFHSSENVEKMRCGVPLTDEDRSEWLQILNELIKSKDSLVVACSALTPKYREILSQGNSDLIFVYLKGSFDTIWSRLNQRKGHYFHGQEMLVSQFETLIEPEPEEAVIVDIEQSAEQILSEIIDKINSSPAAE